VSRTCLPATLSCSPTSFRSRPAASMCRATPRRALADWVASELWWVYHVLIVIPWQYAVPDVELTTAISMPSMSRSRLPLSLLPAGPRGCRKISPVYLAFAIPAVHQ
jgi:hypothetical protein